MREYGLEKQKHKTEKKPLERLIGTQGISYLWITPVRSQHILKYY